MRARQSIDMQVETIARAKAARISDRRAIFSVSLLPDGEDPFADRITGSRSSNSWSSDYSRARLYLSKMQLMF